MIINTTTMKYNYNFILAITLVLVMTLACGAQSQNQEFTIPLSDPSSPGVLVAKLHRGSVTVTGYSGKDVLVTVIPSDDDDDIDEDRAREGLRRIPNTATQFKIEENDNYVKLSGTHNKQVNFEVKVPQNFSLQLGTHHDGDIGVENVIGEIEADGHHGDIEMKSVGGSVIADTHHGEIIVSFVSIDNNKPMAFSTYHGDIDITFPKGVNASSKIKSSRGEIYSDFDIDLKVESAKTMSSDKKGTKIEIGGWLRGDIGTGGPEYLFSTYHGDVILRMK